MSSAVDSPPAAPPAAPLEEDASTYEGAKAIATAHIKAGAFDAAAEAYGAALLLAPAAAQRAVILANRAHAHLGRAPPRHEEALRDAVAAVAAAPRYAKAHYRLSKALAAAPGSAHAAAAAEALARSKRLAKSVVGSADKPGPNAFAVERELGAGNFSTVQLATHKASGELFALKVMEKANIAKLRKRHPNIHNEVQMEKVLLNRLCGNGTDADVAADGGAQSAAAGTEQAAELSNTRCPHIIKLYHTFQDSAKLYFLMEYCPGTELWSLLMQHGHLSGCRPSLARHVAAQVVQGLAFLRAQRVVHRDLKPENVLVNDDGRVVLVDFGTGKDLPPNAGAKLNGPPFVGTAEYMSPEAVCNSKHLGPAADLWALGCVLYQCVAGESPFKGGSQYLTHLKTKRGLRKGFPFPPHADATLVSLVRALLQLEPAARLGADQALTMEGGEEVALVCEGDGAAAFGALRAHPYFAEGCCGAAAGGWAGLHRRPLPPPTEQEKRVEALQKWLLAEVQRIKATAQGGVAWAEAEGDVPPPEPLEALPPSLREHLRHFLSRQQLLGPPFGHAIVARLFRSPADARFLGHQQRKLLAMPYETQRMFKGAFHFAMLADLRLGWSSPASAASAAPPSSSSSPAAGGGEEAGGKKVEEEEEEGEEEDGAVPAEEMALLRRTLLRLNALRPRFVVLCGDCVAADCATDADMAAQAQAQAASGGDGGAAAAVVARRRRRRRRRRLVQMTALRQALLVLDPAIPLISVCGEGQPWRAEQPPPPAEGAAAAASADGGDDVGVHERAFGADRFGFWCAGVRCVVLNSALLCGGGGEGGGGGGGADGGDGDAAAAAASAAAAEAEEREDQEQWLEQCLDESKLNAHYSLVFAHRPWFSRSFDEEDGAGGVANVPKRARVEWLKKFRECNVEAILTGTTAVEVGGVEAGVGAAAAGSLSVPEMVPMEGNLVDLAGLNGEAAKKKATKAVAAAAAGEGGGGSGSGDDDGEEDEFRPPRGREGLVPGHGIQSLPTAPYLSGGGGGLVRIVRVLEEGVRSEVYATDALPEEVSLPKTNHAQDFHETSQ